MFKENYSNLGEERQENSCSLSQSILHNFKATMKARRNEARELNNTFADLTAGAANDDAHLTPAELDDLRTIEALTADEAPATPVRNLVNPASRRKRRRSAYRDLQDRYTLRNFERATGTPAPGAQAEAVEKSPTPLPPSSPASIALWRDTTEVTKVTFYNRALIIFGKPFAFTLNLHPDLIAAANDNERGFLDYVRRRVARELKKEFGRDMPHWLMIETTDDGRPHIHGGLVLSPELAAAEALAATRALESAGGSYTTQGSYPADVRAEYDPDGWARYSLKRIGRTKRHLRDAAGLAPKTKVAILSVTRELRCEAEHLHKQIRATMKHV